MLIKCIIVEDEKLAQDVLQKYIALIPTLQLVNVCSSASEAISFLHSNTVDLIFLDINMPELNGIDFLKTLQHPPHIIITTAYSEFALEGYEYSVCDYLLKPIRYERFIKAVNVVMERNNNKKQLDENLNSSANETLDYIFIKEDYIMHKIFFNDLIFIQAYGNYLKIYTTYNKTIVARVTLTEVESQLPNDLFLRVHKSYLVNIKSIDKIHHNDIYIQDKIIPLGTTYKQEVLKKIKS